MRIALATCSKLPDCEIDDLPLHRALTEQGVTIFQPSWDDETFDWQACDACLIRTTWDYTDRCDEFVAWSQHVAKQTHLFNSAGIVRWNTHKSYLRDLADRGVPTVPTVWLEVDTSVDLPRILKEQKWDRAFLKPAIGATSRETLRFTADDQGFEHAQQHLKRMLQKEIMMLQPYLESVEQHGEISAIVIDGKVTHAVRKTPVPGDYRVQDDFGATDELIHLTDEQMRLVHHVLDQLDERVLYARTDFLQATDGSLLLNELELVEPSLFFRHAPHAASKLANGLLKRL